MSNRLKCVIMGAAGRDFHDFQTFFQLNPQLRVLAFTATQIPFIEQRTFPRSLAGEAYDADIPIHSEEKLPELIERLAIDFVFLAYSDLSHEEVMHKASLVQACGAAFALLGTRQTQLTSSKPVLAVTAVRTGAGKSPLSQHLARLLTAEGAHVGVIRHPMPYGNLEKQAVERFANLDDLDKYECTIEEREEYEPYLEQGQVIFAGVNYRDILTLAEQEADVIVWDGGNNDYSFIRPDLSIVVADALRPGHEVSYYPGETNLRLADIVVVNKVDQAQERDIHCVRENIERVNPAATKVQARLKLELEQGAEIKGQRVVVVEDGPTLTHGGMSYGAGMLVAQSHEAASIIDPRPHAVGTIADTYRNYPHLENVLPALGYSSEQCCELEQTINACEPDVVIDASPAGLDRIVSIQAPFRRVRYRFAQVSGPSLDDAVLRWYQKRLGQ